MLSSRLRPKRAPTAAEEAARRRAEAQEAAAAAAAEAEAEAEIAAAAAAEAEATAWAALERLMSAREEDAASLDSAVRRAEGAVSPAISDTLPMLPRMIAAARERLQALRLEEEEARSAAALGALWDDRHSLDRAADVPAAVEAAAVKPPVEAAVAAPDDSDLLDYEEEDDELPALPWEAGGAAADDWEDIADGDGGRARRAMTAASAVPSDVLSVELEAEEATAAARASYIAELEHRIVTLAAGPPPPPRTVSPLAAAAAAAAAAAGGAADDGMMLALRGQLHHAQRTLADVDDELSAARCHARTLRSANEAADAAIGALYAQIDDERRAHEDAVAELRRLHALSLVKSARKLHRAEMALSPAR